MYFLIENEELLKKYNDIWTKVSNSMKKEFDSEPICDKELLRTKIKTYGDKAKDFHDEETPKSRASLYFLAVISINLFLKKMKTINPKCF